MTPNVIEYAVVTDPEQLRERRNELGLTLRQVARIAGLKSHTYLIELEKGRRHTCSAETAWGIGIALRLTHTQLRAFFEFRTVPRAA